MDTSTRIYTQMLMNICTQTRPYVHRDSHKCTRQCLTQYYHAKDPFEQKFSFVSRKTKFLSDKEIVTLIKCFTTFLQNYFCFRSKSISCMSMATLQFRPKRRSIHGDMSCGWFGSSSCSFNFAEKLSHTFVPFTRGTEDTKSLKAFQLKQ